MNHLEIVTLETDLKEKLNSLCLPNREKCIRIGHLSIVNKNSINVLFFTNQAVLKRNSAINIFSYIKKEINDHLSQFDNEFKIEIEYINVFKEGWPRPYGESFFSSSLTFVGKKNLNGTLEGGLFYDTHLFGSLTKVAAENVDGIDFDKSLSKLKHMDSWYELAFDKTLKADSDKDLINKIKAEGHPSLALLIYANDLWNNDFYNGNREEFQMIPLSQSQQIPISDKAKEKKVSLDNVVNLPTFKSPPLRLEKEKVQELLSLNLSREGAFDYLQYHKEPAVVNICKMWNDKVKRKFHAGAFRLYIWDEGARTFFSGDPQEPNWEPSYFESYQNDLATLDVEFGGKRVFAVFLFSTDRELWEKSDDGYGIVINTVSGELLYEVGTQKNQYDEAFYSWVGLHALKGKITDNADFKPESCMP